MTMPVKFEPTSFVDKLRDRMKAALVDIIPEEQWDAMLRAEVKAFFEETTQPSSGYYQNIKVPSGFRQAVRRVLEDETRKRAIAMLDGPDWTSHWDGSRQVAGKAVTEIVRENAAEIMTNLFRGIAQNVVEQMRQGLRP